VIQHYNISKSVIEDEVLEPKALLGSLGLLLTYVVFDPLSVAAFI
jgi:hypothetical protein